MSIDLTNLQKLIQASGLLTDAEFAIAKEEAERTGRTIENVLVGEGYLTEAYLAEIVAPYYGAPVIDLKQVELSPTVVGIIPEAFAKAKHIVAFEDDAVNKKVKVAMLDPLDLDTIAYLRAKLGKWVEPYLTTEAGLHHGLRHYKGKGEEVGFDKAISENIERSLSLADSGDLSKTAEAVPIVAILDNVIEQAVVLDATDIHFEPIESGTLVRFRIDGILREMFSLPKQIAPILVARVKILASLRIDEHQMPQDGRFRFELEDGSTVDIRTNVMPVLKGEKVEMRLLRSSARPLSLGDLGLQKDTIEIMREEIKKPHGMIVVTGPTGHGKTTTLYAILNILNTQEVNITTVEDPIEYELPRVNQTQVNEKAGITFANGLRALLRQNPDIIMIGEVRDSETVEIAIQSALTGHLLLTTLHTNDAPSAIPRLIDLGAQPFLLSSTLNVAIAQRLVRRICTSCIESYPISPAIKKLVDNQIKLSGDTVSIKPPKTLYRGKGCNVCGGSGFRGQIGIFEVMRVSDPIKELILKSASALEIRRVAIKEGMLTMFEDGLLKVESGVTTIEEVLRVVQE